MADKAKIEKVKAKLQEYKSKLDYYHGLFMMDGFIDDLEQTQLNQMQATIKKAEARLDEMLGMPTQSRADEDKRKAVAAKKRKARAAAKKKAAEVAAKKAAAKASETVEETQEGKKEVGIPTTKEEFIQLYKKQDIGFPIKFNKLFEFKDIKATLSVDGKITLAPSPSVKGTITVKLEGIEKAIGSEDEIGSVFTHELGGDATKLSIDMGDLANFKYDNSKEVTIVNFDLDIIGIIAGKALSFLSDKTKGVFVLGAKGKMGVTGKWDKDGFDLSQIRSDIEFEVTLEPSKHEKLKEYFGGKDAKIGAKAGIKIDTVSNGKGFDTTTAEGEVVLSIEIGDFKRSFTKQGKGQAIGSPAERRAAAEAAIVDAIKQSFDNIDINIKTVKEQIEQAKKANRIFYKVHSRNRTKIEEQLKSKSKDIDNDNWRLGGVYQNAEDMFEYHAEHGVYVKQIIDNAISGYPQLKKKMQIFAANRNRTVSFDRTKPEQMAFKDVAEAYTFTKTYRNSPATDTEGAKKQIKAFEGVVEKAENYKKKYPDVYKFNSTYQYNIDKYIKNSTIYAKRLKKQFPL